MASSSLFFLLFVVFAPLLSVAGPVAREFVYPNFTASYLHFIDNSGVFLSSSAFAAAFHNPGRQPSRYYLAVLHAPSGAVVWTANPAAPVPPSANLALTSASLALALPDGSLAWSTPRLAAPIAALQLLPSGELRLLDSANASLWSSFDHPTDTLLPDQLLPASASLFSAISDSDPAPGDYRLLVTPADSLLQWTPTSLVYWSISSDLRATKDSNFQVSYMAVNGTGLYLLAGDRKTAVFRMIFPPPTSSFPDGFHIAKLDPSGRFRILSFSPNESLSAVVLDTDFVAPSNDCDLPSACGSLGLCTPGANSSKCSCPPSMGPSPAGGCSPSDGSILANASCRHNAEGDGETSATYMSLGRRIGYFGTKFSMPVASGANISVCQYLCSGNCSCLGFFYKNSSKSCYLLEHHIGSLFIVDDGGDNLAAGYIKTLNRPSPPSPSNKFSSSVRFVIILLPSTATFLLVICISFMYFTTWRRNTPRMGGMTRIKSMTSGLRWPMAPEFSEEEEDDDDKEEEITITGLPTRPSMTAVAAMLEGTTPACEPRLKSLNYLSLYGGGSRDPNGRRGSATASPPLSYVSSQEVSGPR
ncbi:hypothetical protein OPV22_032720 [Ensete ventricosum]|uniref:Bulb-type lectin domain-containing protein n=1 Tax=Ensete ventricosum TaxID=4639 RepID=A0AAV8Q005_ENSVE|nr:hypothetical protein OPV22_032720 [Ensete ventricosum]